MTYNINIIKVKHLRWSISWQPHAEGTDRRKPRDAGERHARQMLLYRIRRPETVFFSMLNKSGGKYE
ncbi:MAG: hypothetical protein FWF94_08815 [Oscillospiraceae bacterium]|nr:hypothetical protein [Oscillospiraceae bacterium]